MSLLSIKLWLVLGVMDTSMVNLFYYSYVVHLERAIITGASRVGWLA